MIEPARGWSLGRQRQLGRRVGAARRRGGGLWRSDRRRRARLGGDGTLTLNQDGSFVYQPEEDFVGADSFTYKANDGSEDSGAATVQITVGAGCDGLAATIAGTSASQTLQGTAAMT